MQNPNRFFLKSLRTPLHVAPVYIGCDTNSEWFITTDPRDAFDFGKRDLAVAFQARLKDRGAYGLSDDGHIWQVCHEL